MEAALIPQVVIVEDNEDFAEGLSDALEGVGFATVIMGNLIDATRYLRYHLASSQPAHPMLVVIDQQLLVNTHPTVEGWVLAFLLRMGEQNGDLHPCWVAAISSDLDTRSRRLRAHEARCDFIVSKAELLCQLRLWYTVTSTDTTPHHRLDEAMVDLHQPAVEMLHVLAQQPAMNQRVWTRQDIFFILGTYSPAIRLGQQKNQAEVLIQQLGGESQALQFIWKVLPKLVGRQQEILRRILQGQGKGEMYEDGLSRREIDREIRLICEAIAAHHNSSI